MDPSLASCRQVLRKLWLFKPWHSYAPVPGHSCPRAFYLGSAPLKLPYFLAHTSDWGVLSILKSRRYKLLIAHGFTFTSHGLYGWEAFLTQGALTHTRIIWAFSPMAPQVLGITPGSSFVLMVFRAFLMEGCATKELGCMFNIVVSH